MKIDEVCVIEIEAEWNKKEEWERKKTERMERTEKAKEIETTYFLYEIEREGERLTIQNRRKNQIETWGKKEAIEGWTENWDDERFQMLGNIHMVIDHVSMSW